MRQLGGIFVCNSEKMYVGCTILYDQYILNNSPESMFCEVAKFVAF